MQKSYRSFISFYKLRKGFIKPPYVQLDVLPYDGQLSLGGETTLGHIAPLLWKSLK